MFCWKDCSKLPRLTDDYRALSTIGSLHQLELQWLAFLAFTSKTTELWLTFG